MIVYWTPVGMDWISEGNKESGGWKRAFIKDLSAIVVLDAGLPIFEHVELECIQG
jgi:hypothetical protein